MRACVLFLLFLLFPGAFWPSGRSTGSWAGRRTSSAPSSPTRGRTGDPRDREAPSLFLRFAADLFHPLSPGKSTEEKSYFFPVYMRHSSGDASDRPLPLLLREDARAGLRGRLPPLRQALQQVQAGRDRLFPLARLRLQQGDGTTRTNVIWPFFSFYSGTRKGSSSAASTAGGDGATEEILLRPVALLHKGRKGARYGQPEEEPLGRTLSICRRRLPGRRSMRSCGLSSPTWHAGKDRGKGALAGVLPHDGQGGERRQRLAPLFAQPAGRRGDVCRSGPSTRRSSGIRARRSGAGKGAPHRQVRTGRQGHVSQRLAVFRIPRSAAQTGFFFPSVVP